MNATTTTQPTSLKVSRLIKAPRDRVFAAWITPTEIMKWLGSESCRMISAKIDPRVGGEYTFRMKTTETGETEMTGIYREIKAPERLVFSWSGCGCNPAMEGHNTQVTVELIEQKGGTLVQITHEGFPTAAARDDHNRGWLACLDNLEKLT